MQLGHELYEEGGILVFETWTAENARVVPNTVHKWKVKREELELESRVINLFVSVVVVAVQKAQKAVKA